MQNIRVADVGEALDVVRELIDEAEYDWFRGQLRCWPLMPSFTRLDDDGQRAALELHQRFVHWVRSTRTVAAMLENGEAMTAVAQHYGIPTNLIDFTTDPRIAAFFASHAVAEPTEPVDSCIYCLHSGIAHIGIEMARQEFLGRGDEEWMKELPELIEIDVANLWRLEAQFGVFLRVPYDRHAIEAGLLDGLPGLVRIVFPYTGPVSDLPRERVYPDRKSRLEVLLDEFFEREGLIEWHEELRAHGHQLLHPDTFDVANFIAAGGWKPEVAAVMQLIAEGRAVEIFANGDVPDPHETWVEGDLAPWMVPIVERFHDTVGDEQQTLVLERANDADHFDDRCIQKVAELLASGALRRDRAVRWHIIGGDTGQELSLAVPFHGEERVGRETVAAWIDVTWDGLRSLPYDDDELAIALGRSIAALAWPALAVDINSPLLDELLPGKLPIDLVSETRGDPLAFVSGSSLRATLRPDLASLLAPGWRHLADQIHLLLMVVGHPAVLFRLDRWRRLFASEIIPAQIYWAATGESEWVIYDFTQIVQIREH